MKNFYNVTNTDSTTKLSLYVCGDSFCTQDLDYGPNWVDLLTHKCSELTVINLSSPGASNYLIFLQVQQALKNNCDYLIYHATSSIRNEFAIADDQRKKDHLERYWSPHDSQNKTVVSNSWVNANRNTNLFSSKSDLVFKEFFANHIDFLSMVGKNYIFIDYTLRMISESMHKQNWAWNRGGFEHFKFSGASDEWDFSNYVDQECAVNLWDDYDRNVVRPYYHVTDPKIHKKVCNLYLDMLNLKSTHDC